MAQALGALNASANYSGRPSKLALLCKAAGDRHRLQILRALAGESFGVLELCRIFAIRQPAMSHHLKVLADAGLVVRRREGNNIYYSRAHCFNSDFEGLTTSLFAQVDELPLSAAEHRRLERIHHERAAASKAFFTANFDNFQQQQELIATPAMYLESLVQKIELLLLPEAAQILELGPGDGWLLPTLSRFAQKLTGVDSSREMLERARRHCQALGLSNVELIEGDNRSLAQIGRYYDLAMANMMLHHTASPASVIADVASTLKPGGALLICDLSAHDQGWVRNACGDYWLGFEAAELDHWAGDAGLSPADKTVLALRNGFQILQCVYLNQND